MGVFIGAGVTECDQPDGYCTLEGNVARAAGPSWGLEAGFFLNHGVAVTLEAEFLADYDLAGSASRVGPSIRYAPWSWFWVGAGPLVGTMNASGDVASTSGLGAQVGAGFELLLGGHLGLGLRAQNAWLGHGFSMVTFDLGLSWHFQRH